MLDLIRQSLAQLSPAERRVAEAILDTPTTAITWSISDAARFAKVSEPSVVRFCRRLDFEGFPDFRLKLAQELAMRQPVEPSTQATGDTFVATVDEIFDRAARTLKEARVDIDIEALRAAVEILAKARRTDVYGYGGSGFLAGEAQHRLASLGLASVAYSDPTLQMISAPRLTPADALLALSFTGHTSYLVSNIEIAKKTGAAIVTIAPAGSVVAALGDVNVNLNAYRSSAHDSFVPTGRAPMYVMLDVIFALLARRLRLGEG